MYVRQINPIKHFNKINPSTLENESVLTHFRRFFQVELQLHTSIRKYRRSSSNRQQKQLLQMEEAKQHVGPLNLPNARLNRYYDKVLYTPL